MEKVAKLNYLRMAPRKVRSCADLIRGMKMDKAKTELQFSKRRAAGPLLKLLESCLANIKKESSLTKEKIDSFYIKKITIDEGAKLKRWKPVARGSAHPIQKKTSRITLVLAENGKLNTKPHLIPSLMKGRK